MKHVQKKNHLVKKYRLRYLNLAEEETGLGLAEE